MIHCLVGYYEKRGERRFFKLYVLKRYDI